MTDWSRKFNQLNETYGVVSQAISANPEIAGYCAKRGAVAGVVGAFDAIPDAAMLLTRNEPVSLASGAVKSGIDKLNGVDTTKWTPDQQLACMGAGILPELATSLIVPVAALKGLGVAKKIEQVAELAKVVQASKITKAAVTTNVAAGTGVGVWGVNEMRKNLTDDTPAVAVHDVHAPAPGIH